MYNYIIFAIGSMLAMFIGYYVAKFDQLFDNHEEKLLIKKIERLGYRVYIGRNKSVVIVEKTDGINRYTGATRLVALSIALKELTDD